MEKEKANPVVKFPSWNAIEKLNKKDDYRGFTIKQNLAENLFVLIEGCNESVIFKEGGEDKIRFSFCTHNNFPIATVQYIYCEQAYYTGIKQLLDWAKTFQEAFGKFREESALEE